MKEREKPEKYVGKELTVGRDASGKEELVRQDGRERLQNKLTYEEHHIRYLQEEIEREQAYRRRVVRKKKENAKGFQQNLPIVLILVYIVIFVLVFTNGFAVTKTEGLGGAIQGVSYLFLIPMVIFAIIGLIKFGPKLIEFAKQLKGMEDPRLRGGYKSYDEMQDISEGRMKYLEEELLQSEMEQEASRDLLTEQIREETSKPEMDVISMDELMQIRQEEIPALPEPEINMKTISMDELYEDRKKRRQSEKETD